MEYVTLIGDRFSIGKEKHSEDFTEVLRDENGVVTNNEPLRLQEEADSTAKLILDGETLVNEYIQAPIDAYNEANKVKFTSVDSCFKYTSNPAYIHYQFCVDIVAFNINVWEVARVNQVTAITEDWDVDTFLASLPSFGA